MKIMKIFVLVIACSWSLCVFAREATDIADITHLQVPLNFFLNELTYNFLFSCTVEEANDKLSLLKSVTDFCYDSLRQLEPAWRHYYSDPIMCVNDVTGSIYDQLLIYKTKKLGVEDVNTYYLASDEWCVDASWLSRIDEHEQRVTSQSGQDGVLEYIFSDEGIGSTNKYYIEIGFNSINFDGGSGANSYHLYRNGWSGLLIDIENENPSINLRKHRVTADNIVSIFDLYGVPREPDYISIDIDSQDLWVLRALLSSGKYRPRVLTVEFNANLPFSSTVTVPLNFNQPGAEIDMLFGASAGALKMVAEEFGYSVVHVIDKLDLVLVRNDLLQGACPKPFFTYYYKVARVQHCIILPERMFQWWDYATWQKTGGSSTLASSAAAEQLVLSIYSATPAKAAKERELKCLGVDIKRLQLKKYGGQREYTVD